MLTVALTGGIACGKSVVGDILRSKGCYVHSSDADARALTAPGGPAFPAVVARFGKEILAPDGTIDRGRLGRIVFADPVSRKDLEAIIHPLVLERTLRLMTEIAAGGRHPLFVTEAALTIEAGFEKFYDRVVVAACGEAIRLRRLMSRDGLGREEAERRIAAQMPQAEKAARADYVIDTSGTLAETVERTERVYALLLREAELKALEEDS